MKLYSLTEVHSVSHPDYDGNFKADEDGGIEFPDEVGLQLHRTHIAGQPVWETQGERSLRLVAEEEARRRDPATLLAAVENLMHSQQAEAPPKPAPTKRTSTSTRKR